jgi:hypothetical protein
LSSFVEFDFESTNCRPLDKRKSRPSRLEPWSETSIDGRPAVVYHEFADPGACSVSVQVTDGQMFAFEITGKDMPEATGTRTVAAASRRWPNS